MVSDQLSGPQMGDKAVLCWLESRELPDKEVVYGLLCQDNRLFRHDESQFWDFKKGWPFSLSDDYFSAIARAVCSFANSFGGILVFGVHDEHRTGGHNKVAVNFDRFRQAVNQLVGIPLSLALRSYSDEIRGDIEILFVFPRARGLRPYRFRKAAGKYAGDIVWIRRGHEVREATPADFPSLFCRSSIAIEDVSKELEGSLPPRPTTIKRFIGRERVIEDLFYWLENSDEPRTYLWGKGGSGKSTIAFEFANILKSFGSEVQLQGREKIDAVIYLSAKEKSVTTLGNLAVEALEPDFYNEETLIKKILFYGRWILDADKLEEMTLYALRQEITEFLDISSVVIFIDDIDTLTTKGIDPGSDFIYRVLCRAKKLSKVLYTLRNAPSQSMTNSTEVPGLNGQEFNEFIAECVHEFKVPEPTEEFKSTTLITLSERRPLLIEGIIALVRTSGSYKKAAQLFEQHDGEQIRDYIFAREWDTLQESSASRPLLAALSGLNQPSTFSQLETVLQVDPSRLRDAIGEVREMFLKIDQSGDETLFSLAPLTRQFVTSRKDTIRTYAVLRERVKAFKRNTYISNPRVAELIIRIERMIPPRYVDHAADKALEAWRVVSDSKLPPLVTEDPLFRSLYGYVASACRPAHLAEAREAFSYAVQMNYEPEYRYLETWYAAERQSGVIDRWCERCADIVISGKKYDEENKIAMISRKASSIYIRGKEMFNTDSTDALQCFQEALVLHLRAFRLNCATGTRYVELSERYARNTMFALFNAIPKDSPWRVIEVFKTLTDVKEVYLDPIEDVVVEFILVARSIRREDVAIKTRQRIKALIDLFRPEQWLSNTVRQRAIGSLKTADEILLKIGGRN
jgi:hypothetical protein